MMTLKYLAFQVIIFSPVKIYKFKPNVKDVDLDINKDQLYFSIENKPKWLTLPPDSQTWEKIWEKIWFEQAMIRGSGNSFNEFENSNPSCTAKNKSCQMPINDSIVYHPAIINVAALNKERERASYSIYNSSNWISAPGGEDSNNLFIRGVAI